MENQKFDEEKFRTATELNIQFQEEFGKKRIDIYEENNQKRDLIYLCL